MQDNGSWAGPAYTWRVQGIRNSYWQEISFGDGFDVLPDPDNHRFGISASQEGSAVIYDRLTGNNEGIQPTHPEHEEKLRFNWNAAMSRDPFNSNTLYFGSQFVHKSIDGGQTWRIISKDLTTNNPEYQKQGESGGLTMDATGAENYCTILVIEPSPIQKELLWTGSDDGQVNISKNGGDDWQNITENIPMPSGAWINQIKASHHNSSEALLVVNDYRRFNDSPMVYRTKDFGQSWEQIVDKNDVIGYALCILQDPVDPNLYFLGTGDGLYVSIDEAKNWNKWTVGFPTTNVMDLVIQPREHDLVIGTFGRAAWVLDDIRPLREIAKNPELVSKESHIFESPTAYLASYQQPSGSRFGGDALYNAENRKYGSMLTYFYKAGEKKNEDSLTLKIFDGERQIRTLKTKAPIETGFHRWYWYMDEKGVNRPSRSDTKRTGEPRGVTVKPGTYKVVLESKNESSETEVNVISPDGPYLISTGYEPVSYTHLTLPTIYSV